MLDSYSELWTPAIATLCHRAAGGYNFLSMTKGTTVQRSTILIAIDLKSDRSPGFLRHLPRHIYQVFGFPRGFFRALGEVLILLPRSATLDVTRRWLGRGLLRFGR